MRRQILHHFSWASIRKVWVYMLSTGYGAKNDAKLTAVCIRLPHGAPLAVRLGIHTGLVVVGELGGSRREQLALGVTPNIAARLQGLAAPNTVVISRATFRLIEGYFACRDLGPQQLRGVATPLQVYQILQVSAGQGRLDVTAPRGLTPLVGREAELALLQRRWAQAKEGVGQVVMLHGEPGI